MKRGIDLEMDFADGLAAMVDVSGIAVARNHARGFVADHFRSLLGFGVDDDLVGTVNLVVGENAVLEHEPARPPSLPVVHPLVQNPRDSVPDEVVDSDIHRRRRSEARAAALAAVGEAEVELGGTGGGVRSRGGGGGERGHGGGGIVGDGGDAAEGMH